MRKQDRHRLITRLLTEKNIQKQEDFVNYLQEKGVAVTQATISRDIKDMKLIKVPSAEGGYRYSLPLETQANTSAKLAKLLKDAFVAAEQMEKYVVLRTIPGNAAACGSLIAKFFTESSCNILFTSFFIDSLTALYEVFLPPPQFVQS